jgi:chromosome segregation ATPase
MRDTDNVKLDDISLSADQLEEDYSHLRSNGSGSTATRSSALVWLTAALVLVTLAAAIGIWYTWQQITTLNAQIVETKTASQSQLSQLGDQLANTDKNLNQSGDQLQSTLKLHDSEIRKLWDLANKRNKSTIATNTKKIADVAKDLTTTEAKLTTISQQLAATKKQLQQYNQNIENLQQQLKTQTSQLNTLVKSAASTSALQGQITSNQQALKEINSYRQQTSNTLLQLRREVSQLRQQLAVK